MKSNLRPTDFAPFCRGQCSRRARVACHPPAYGWDDVGDASLIGQHVLLKRLSLVELIEFAHDGQNALNRVVRTFV
jgi:hypothetical protein